MRPSLRRVGYPVGRAVVGRSGGRSVGRPRFPPRWALRFRIPAMFWFHGADFGSGAGFQARSAGSRRDLQGRLRSQIRPDISSHIRGNSRGSILGTAKDDPTIAIPQRSHSATPRAPPLAAAMEWPTMEEILQLQNSCAAKQCRLEPSFARLFGEFWPMWSMVWPTLGPTRPILVELGQSLAKLGKALPDSGPTRIAEARLPGTLLGNSWAAFRQLRSSVGLPGELSDTSGQQLF